MATVFNQGVLVEWRQGKKLPGKVTFKNSRGFKLVANIIGLRKGKSLPVVIFAHGLNSSKDSPRNLYIAEGVVKKGMVCFLLDFTGHGESEGKISDVTVAQFVQDLDACISYIESLDGIDSSKIGVCGSSMGGTATFVKASSDKRITAIVLRSAPSEGYYQYAEHINIPTLIVQGDADPIAGESKILYKHLAGEKKLVLIKGADHLYTRQEHMEEAKGAIVAWFIENLREYKRVIEHV